MRVLGLDTSSPITAAAITADGQVLAEDDSATEARHGEVLLPRIERLLACAGLRLGELDLIAVGTGPGSFTGLRVGLATAKGLALATPLALRGVDSLAVLARGARQDAGLVVPILDAFKGEVFAAVYRIGDGGELCCECAAFNAEPEAAARVLSAHLRSAHPGQSEAVVCGDGARRYRDSLQPGLAGSARWAPEALDLPRGRHVAALGAALYQADGASDLAGLEPSYVRGSDAQLPKAPLSV